MNNHALFIQKFNVVFVVTKHYVGVLEPHAFMQTKIFQFVGVFHSRLIVNNFSFRKIKFIKIKFINNTRISQGLLSSPKIENFISLWNKNTSLNWHLQFKSHQQPTFLFRVENFNSVYSLTISSKSPSDIKHVLIDKSIRCASSLIKILNLFPPILFNRISLTFVNDCIKIITILPSSNCVNMTSKVNKGKSVSNIDHVRNVGDFISIEIVQVTFFCDFFKLNIYSTC